LIVQAQTPARHVTRLALILAAAMALILSAALSARPVAAGGTQVWLHEPHQGTDSSDSDFECDPSDDPGPGEVLWHFVLNGVDPGYEAALTLNATFTDDGALADDSGWVGGGQTHHFYITTSGDDVLETAYVFLPPGDYVAGNLVLSHICRGPEESASPTPEGSEAGGTGTPAPSVPDTATSLPGMAGPLATVVFGLILLGSLGALAYANVTAVRRRS